MFTTAVPSAATGETAAEVRDRIAGTSYESATELVVLEGDHFVGLAPVEALLAAEPDAPVGNLIGEQGDTLLPDADAARAAHILGTTGRRAIAVVDHDDRFMGIVPPAEIVALLNAEHDEDLARLGGYVAGSDRARSAAEEPIARRLQHRLPWLLIGLVGAMVSAVVVGAFEEQLAANVLIALFIPAVVYMADAVGTQTETVLIRGLAAGITPRSVLWRELFTGAITGFVIGAAFFVFAAVGWGDFEVALAVAVALLACCSIATMVAMVLPSVFQRLGKDPAFGSGPLATVVQDLLSIVVYLGAVTLIIS